MSFEPQTEIPVDNFFTLGQFKTFLDDYGFGFSADDVVIKALVDDRLGMFITNQSWTLMQEGFVVYDLRKTAFWFGQGTAGELWGHVAIPAEMHSQVVANM